VIRNGEKPLAAFLKAATANPMNRVNVIYEPYHRFAFGCGFLRHGNLVLNVNALVWSREIPDAGNASEFRHARVNFLHNFADLCEERLFVGA
jgi:hypothetical protein